MKLGKVSIVLQIRNEFTLVTNILWCLSACIILYYLYLYQQYQEINKEIKKRKEIFKGEEKQGRRTGRRR